KAGAWFNLPAVAIMLIVTTILVIGIRESAISNTLLVVIKLGVVVFVIAVGAGFIVASNWTSIPPEQRKLAQEQGIPDAAADVAKGEDASLAALGAFKAHLSDAAKSIALQVSIQKKDGTTVNVPIPEEKDLTKRSDELEAQALAIYLLDRAEKI